MNFLSFLVPIGRALTTFDLLDLLVKLSKLLGYFLLLLLNLLNSFFVWIFGAKAVIPDY